MVHGRLYQDKLKDCLWLRTDTTSGNVGFGYNLLIPLILITSLVTASFNTRVWLRSA